MNKLINPRIQLCLIAAIGAAILLANPAPSLAQAPQTKRTQQIDLRPAMKQMNLKEGRNVVYSGAGVKLMAEVKGGKVARWTATDNNGKPLPTRIERADTCMVCIISEQGKTSCYEVDCKTIPPPPKAARQ